MSRSARHSRKRSALAFLLASALLLGGAALAQADVCRPDSWEWREVASTIRSEIAQPVPLDLGGAKAAPCDSLLDGYLVYLSGDRQTRSSLISALSSTFGENDTFEESDAKIEPADPLLGGGPVVDWYWSATAGSAANDYRIVFVADDRSFMLVQPTR